MRTFTEEEVEEMMDSVVCEKPKTNADRIRSMSDEELAEQFVYWDCDGADYTTDLPINGCKWGSKEEMLSRVLEYLQSEMEE